ncbi:pyridoxal phosphate-dependent aminotransferase [Azospirillum doebereinerae]|uniref:pyridoxal phosphate-dependent aminotransferase n=1 Tax=Azospirillum doebereinerae TaxID=92933 RepID=UPI001EE4F45D|nr:aminotransferase class I/II-fold pyridoxal phosphate-dependent enzyme [Azospirillum doebereinerae]MCG5239984.1 aminotransferase class I/II-fold pyridoxal phosphate-dependent enzyme [Azospirillum doebereinerae]
MSKLPKVSKRGAIPPFFVMEVMRAAAEREAAGLEVLHMEVGQPSTGAPRRVVEAAANAVVGTDPLGYTGALGIPPLRAAIAKWYRDRYGVTVPESRVVVTTGSSGAFQLGFLAAFDPGDRVAMASPSYPAYRHTLTAIGVEPVELPTGPEHRFQPTVELLEKLDRPVQGLIVASPANPTGTMLSRAELTALSDWCKANGVRMVSDEIYHGLTYGTDAVTAAEVNEHALVVNSFSKYFSMTGWRLGWMIVPDDLIRSVECLAQNLFISAPTLSQVSAVAAFDSTEELEGHIARYARNRALLLEELPKAGFTKLAPADGAFYIYADVSAMTDDSEAFAKRILEETGIACTPGIDFDPARGRRFLRFSFAGAEATIAEAARRLIAWRR